MRIRQYLWQFRNQGGAGEAKHPLEKFLPPLEKMCWTQLETVGQISKVLGSSQNYSPLLVSQAGCGPDLSFRLIAEREKVFAKYA